MIVDRTASEWVRRTTEDNRAGLAKGIFSVCSAHPAVLQAALHHARDHRSFVCIESTSNQVNQYGGYTGQTPAQFARYINSFAEDAGLEREHILLGGDHLGPYPWRNEPAQQAVEKGSELVRACVLAGYQKIHLDASMACADDTHQALDDEIVGQRAAQLCVAAEQAWEHLPSGSPRPLYVIGTEVPVPGGETTSSTGPQPTTLERMQKTLKTSHAAFVARGLSDAWTRVIGLVVQPGVEFGDESIFDYVAEQARALSENLPESPALVYEAHSTDYQRPDSLRHLVQDHFAILKVGPWLTFAYREAVFALGAIEREMLGSRKDVVISDVPGALEQAMLRNPVYWKAYYPANEERARFARRYSLSDRCRYYWPDSPVQSEVGLLIGNLSHAEIPLSLISQYLPRAYEEIREGCLPNHPKKLVEHRIREVLDIYWHACSGTE